jgi:hypothetical protein
MFRELALLACVVAAGFSAEAAATSCVHPPAITGGRSGSTTSAAEPETTQGCVLMGRIYCRLAEQRDADVDQAQGTRFVRLWLEEPKVGSHIGANWSSGPAAKMLDGAAAYVYAHRSTRPWSLHDYAVHACGVSLAATQAKADVGAAGARYETAARACLAKFPGEGDGYDNEDLRACLGEAQKSAM